jgi:hypothetical protein
MTKQARIVRYYAAHPKASRKEVAKAAGSSVGRVGEVVRSGKVRARLTTKGWVPIGSAVNTTKRRKPRKR